MRPPIVRFPTRDAKDADHMAIIAVAAGIYLLWGRTGFAAVTAPWTSGIAAAAILAGVLLWLRVPATKWLGVFVFLFICGLAVRHCLVQGWRLGTILGVLIPVVCAYWMAGVDYSHTFNEEEGSKSRQPTPASPVAALPPLSARCGCGEADPASHTTDHECQLPQGYVLIDKQRHDHLNTTMFNPAADGMETESRFSDKFNKEIGSVMGACSDLLARYGEFGSLERHDKGLPSDWWINDDFCSVSRVLFIEFLDGRMQTYPVIEGLRDLLCKFPSDWMLMAGHDNAYDNRGQCVEKAGSYYFWIRKEMVEVYSERSEDLNTFYRSLDANAA